VSFSRVVAYGLRLNKLSDNCKKNTMLAGFYLVFIVFFVCGDIFQLLSSYFTRSYSYEWHGV